MAKDSDRQMTIPELLEARAQILQRLTEGTGGQRMWGSEVTNTSAREELLPILREIEAELAEQGYKAAEGS